MLIIVVYFTIQKIDNVINIYIYKKKIANIGIKNTV